MVSSLWRVLPNSLSFPLGLTLRIEIGVTVYSESSSNAAHQGIRRKWLISAFDIVEKFFFEIEGRSRKQKIGIDFVLII